MNARRCLVSPRALEDLDAQALFYAERESPELGYQFLQAADKTFALLAEHPLVGWHPKLDHPTLRDLRVFRISRFPKVLLIYRPTSTGVEILRAVHGSRNLEAWVRRERLT